MDTHAIQGGAAATSQAVTTTRTGTSQVIPTSAPAPTRRRHDLYGPIHKALRLFMTRTLCTVGATDPAEPDEVSDSLAMLERLLALCEVHLQDENEFVHPAMEQARPGSSARVVGEHVHHGESIADLRDLAGLVRDSRDGARADALGRLYRALALFVAENLQHMHVEETTHAPLLWAAFTDAELEAIEQRIVASIPTASMAEALHWFMPALNASERAGMLAAMQQGMPPEPFQGVLEIARRTLDTRQHARLMRDLGLPVAPGLMTA